MDSVSGCLRWHILRSRRADCCYLSAAKGSEIITSRELISSYTLNRGLGDPDDVAEVSVVMMKRPSIRAD